MVTKPAKITKTFAAHDLFVLVVSFVGLLPGPRAVTVHRIALDILKSGM